MRELRNPSKAERRKAVIRLVRELCAAGVPPVKHDALERALGVTHSQLGRMLDEGEKVNLPLAALSPLTDELGKGVLEAFARVHGYHLVRDTAAGDLAERDLVHQAAVALCEASDAVAKVTARSRDGLTPDEAAELEPEIEQAIAALLALRELVACAWRQAA